MIKFINDSKNIPYIKFKEEYEKAVSNNQHAIEAISISSFNKDLNEVDSRYVNLKYILNDEWVFFSNYDSPKAQSFISHDQISALFYWSSINIQVRIKAKIKKTSQKFSDEHFISRSVEKNALAISSKQSKIIESYEKVVNDYNVILENKESLTERPANWGGFSFTPYYFEFWKGNSSRLNKRDIYEMNNGEWIHSILQP